MPAVGIEDGTTFKRGTYNKSNRLYDAPFARSQGNAMGKFLLWCILFVLCWPVALAALVLYPIVWLFLLPFRIVGIAVGGVLELVSAIIFLPVQSLRGI